MSFFWVYSEVTSDSRDFDKANFIVCQNTVIVQTRATTYIFNPLTDLKLVSENKKNGTAYKSVIIEIRAINKISFNASLNKKNKEKIEVQIISFNLIEILL